MKANPQLQLILSKVMKCSMKRFYPQLTVKEQTRNNVLLLLTGGDDLLTGEAYNASFVSYLNSKVSLKVLHPETRFKESESCQ